MADYVGRARALAERLTDIPGLLLQPTLPQVNAFQVWIRGDTDLLAARNRAFAATHRIWLFNGFQPASLSSHAIAEVVIGDASEDYAVAEAFEWVREFASSTA